MQNRHSLGNKKSLTQSRRGNHETLLSLRLCVRLFAYCFRRKRLRNFLFFGIAAAFGRGGGAGVAHRIAVGILEVRQAAAASFDAAVANEDSDGHCRHNECKHDRCNEKCCDPHAELPFWRHRKIGSRLFENLVVLANQK